MRSKKPSDLTLKVISAELSRRRSLLLDPESKHGLYKIEESHAQSLAEAYEAECGVPSSEEDINHEAIRAMSASVSIGYDCGYAQGFHYGERRGQQDGVNDFISGFKKIWQCI